MTIEKIKQLKAKNEENNQIPEDEINNLKQYLYSTYSVEMERIHINE